MDKTEILREKNRARVRRHREVQREVRHALFIHAQANTPVSSVGECVDERIEESRLLEPMLPEREDFNYNAHDIVTDYTVSPLEPDDVGVSSSDETTCENEGNHLQQNDEIRQLDVPEEVKQIREWALECNIPQAHLDKLLKILRHRLLPELPKSSKTLLRTSSMPYEILEIQDDDGNPGGSYVYFGIRTGLQICVNPELHPNRSIYLQINVDGLPIFASSKVQFWPILCKVFCNPDVYKPFLVAIFCGEAKPRCVNIFLSDFASEINELFRDGIEISGIIFTVRIQCFICDTPARSFMKMTKGHGGYSACERCVIHGSRVERRTVYPNIDCQERTDESFRIMQDRNHHNGRSVLLTIRPHINMVTSFVLDFMHLCCVGVMKRLLVQNWLSGNLRVKINQRNKIELSRRLRALYEHIPVEFQRKARGVEFATQWKATEFRFLLLYSGPIVLRDILPENLYKHFLLLHVACRILCTEELAQTQNARAKLYLRRFLEILPRLYGAHSVVLNMHNLIHLPDDAKNMGSSLSGISAFPFENFLGQLKKLVRTPNLPLEQICRRIYEKSFFPIEKAMPIDRFTILKKSDKIVNGQVDVYKIRYSQFTLTTKTPNDMVLLRDKRVIKIKKIFFDEDSPNDVKITGAIWKIEKNIFSYPTLSENMYMWELRSRPSETMCTYFVDSIERKIVKLALRMYSRGRQKVFAIPFLH